MQLKGIAFVPEITEANERAVRNLNLQIAKEKPDSIIVVSPEGHMFVDAVSVDYTMGLNDRDGMEYQCDMGILDDMNKILTRMKVPNIFLNPQKAEQFDLELKVEPRTAKYLSLLGKVLPEFKIALLTTGPLEKGELLECGRSIREAVETAGHKAFLVVLLGEEAGEFNEALKAAVETGEFMPFVEFNPKPLGEAEYDSALIGVGATEMLKTTAAVEDCGETCALLTFNVEQVELNPRPPKDGKPHEEVEFTAPSLIERWKEVLARRREQLRAAESDVLKMVRASVELWVTEGKRLDFETYANTAITDKELLTRLKNQRTGVFVTIVKNGRPRGTMGTVNPICENIALEMINNSIEAAAYDPQFVPVAPQELDELTYEVIVLDPPTLIDDLDELDPSKFGIIVEQGLKRGVVLPGIEGITSVEEQLELAKQRAGINEVIDSWEPLIISKFSADVF